VLYLVTSGFLRAEENVRRRTEREELQRETREGRYRGVLHGGIAIATLQQPSCTFSFATQPF
jgi:hypothetical protein